MIDTVELRKMANAASCGQWHIQDLAPAIANGAARPGPDGTAYRISADHTLWFELRAFSDGYVLGANKANAMYIFNTQPKVIIELLDRLERAEARVAELLK